MKIALIFLIALLSGTALHAIGNLDRVVLEGHLDDSPQQQYSIEFVYAPAPPMEHYPNAPKSWTILKKLRVTLNKAVIDVPDAAISDLFWPAMPDRPTLEPDGSMRLSFGGSSGEHSYTVDFFFKSGRLVSRDYYPHATEKPVTTRYESGPHLPAAERPNIVIILADDLGYGSVGCYGADPALVRTPNIDRIAREGRRFTDANTTSSVCSPTRYSLLTGRYCWRTSLKNETLSTFAPLHIETTRPTMASLLKQHGYATAAIGKWHLGYGTADGSPKWRTDYTAELVPGPLELGFDYHFSVPQNHGDVTGVFVENHFVYGLRSGKIPPGMKIPGPVPDDDNFQDGSAPTDMGNPKAQPLALDAPHRKNERVMATLTDKATRWIGQQSKDKPFFLYFTPVAVHEPVTPDKDIAGQSKAGLFGDWIYELDRSVGRILESLDKQGLADNTLVLFTSDNGGIKEPGQKNRLETLAVNAGLAVNGPWRGGKTHVWDGGFKVPFVVRWPGHAAADSVCNEMVSLADIMATTAMIVDGKLPAADQAAGDSYDILPAILGQNSKPLRRDMILHSNDGVYAIRKGPWKWIEGVPVKALSPGLRKAHADEFHEQLYNTRDDPAETTDLSAAYPELVQEMRALLARYRDGAYSREMPPMVAK